MMDVSDTQKPAEREHDFDRKFELRNDLAPGDPDIERQVQRQRTPKLLIAHAQLKGLELCVSRHSSQVFSLR